MLAGDATVPKAAPLVIAMRGAYGNDHVRADSVPCGATRTKPACSRSFVARQQRGVAAGRRGVDGHCLFGGKACEIMRPAGLGTSAGETVAAERLHADDRADHVAVDIDVAGR